MKVSQFLLAVLFAVGAFLSLPAGQSQAETRFHLMVPGWFPPPPPRRHYYYPEPREEVYGYSYEDYEDEPYYDPEDEDEYYQGAPQYYAPPPRKRKPATAYSRPDDYESAPAPKKIKPAAKAQTDAKPETTGTQTSVSCEKAKSIITGYGFGNVETKSCSGKVYSFAARRDGKNFSVKVSALNGELTEVKRQ